ncbi:MAG: hypothetical protein KatS3mg077_0840 [Candidatus Binatia bacterium]|nr:MAG: hypothetical protein KatS3mg077_0840 [Candidatus Binatia bacterium]
MVLLASCRGQHQGPGTIEGKRVDDAIVAERAAKDRSAVTQLAPAATGQKQILFGDFHVHTTFSADAFLRSLPMLQGEGTHPPADACDFARYCSGLDFWSINDHAEALTPRHWQETKEAIRQCNALAGDPKNPDVVAFLGWEWSQVGRTAAEHYGHRNVILRHTDEERVPKRPISALDDQLIGALRAPAPLRQRLLFPLLDWPNRQRYYDFGEFQRENREVPLCPRGVDTRELPPDCHENARTPAELFEKLAQGGYEAIVIPHGTTWGFYTPPDASWDKQLVGRMHDPSRQFLFEIYSGHGNSEEYREWRPVAFDDKGEPICPAPTKDYLPCCWQAGEIIRKRCGNIPAGECERRVAEARKNYLKAGVAGQRTIPGAEVEDWLDCGQCRNCFNPAFNYRPANSAQYILALSNFDDGRPRRFRFGFMASSDNHSARPGTGYKEYGRRMMTEAAGARDAKWRERLLRPEKPQPESRPFDPARSNLQPFQILEFERQASFFMTGGLIAVHSEGRDRDAIWRALQRREVYATSGDRILLWFDLLQDGGTAVPMGAETVHSQMPRFRVRAIGARKQLPGCPDYARRALTPERLDRLCRGECYNPSDERLRITEIHVIRIRPQESPAEPIGSLIEDPWRRFECPNSSAGCEVEFEDPDYPRAGREFIYYVRALQEPTLAVNAGGLRCRYDEQGNCLEVRPCYGDYRTPYEDDCLWPNQERAWSSPIYLRPPS